MTTEQKIRFFNDFGPVENFIHHPLIIMIFTSKHSDRQDNVLEIGQDYHQLFSSQFLQWFLGHLHYFRTIARMPLAWKRKNHSAFGTILTLVFLA